MSDLFGDSTPTAVAGNAPRPLADRLRPQSLADVIGAWYPSFDCVVTVVKTLTLSPSFHEIGLSFRVLRTGSETWAVGYECTFESGERQGNEQGKDDSEDYGWTTTTSTLLTQ